MAVEGDNMRVADAMSATEHLLLRELPTHVHVGRLSGGEPYFLFSRRGRPYFLFSGGGGSVCVVFFWPRNTTLFQRNEQIYCILIQETCIKACCTVLKEYHGPLNCNCLFKNTLSKQCYTILSARNTILLQMTIPCIAFSYRNITLFQRDCCVYIYERVSFGTRT